MSKYDKWIVVDVETTQNSKRAFKAEPHDPANKVLYVGLLDNEDRMQIRDKDGEIVSVPKVDCGKGTCVLVGHHIIFDLHYLSKCPDKEVKAYMRRVRGGHECVWDTQIAEYLLTGQHSKFSSLDELSAKYGGTLKDTVVSDMMKAGVPTEDIPKEKLIEYLEGDLKNTAIVFKAQVQVATKLGMMPLIEAHMKDLIAIYVIEQNGMYVDRNKLAQLRSKYIKVMEKMEETILRAVPREHRHLISLTTNSHLAAILFGGKIPYVKKVPAGVFKTGPRKGQLKFANVDTELELPVYTAIRLDHPLTPKSGAIKMDAECLVPYKGTTVGNAILEYKLAKKTLDTFIKGLEKCVWPRRNKVYTTIHQCSTNTGRPSSSNPNMQNYPRSSTSDVKEVFTSRRGEEGRILEIDYKQIEVIGLAYKTQDRRLIQEIKDGVHIHTQRAKEFYHTAAPNEEQIQLMKVMTFELQYGAGAKTLARNHDITLVEARRFIHDFFNKYEGVRQWRINVMEELKSNRIVCPTKRTPKGFPVGVSYITCPTGRRYTFREYDAPDWMVAKGVHTTFSPTEVFNYPIQGFATGDIMAVVRGRLHSIMNDSQQSSRLMINTVHDSIVFDVPSKSTVRTFSTFLKVQAEKAPEWIRDAFPGCSDFDLPLHVDIKAGPSWGELKEVKL